MKKDLKKTCTTFQALLDLHGGQGSQNGFDNSGKRGEIHFQDGENSDRAVKVLSQMSALVKSWVDEGSIKVVNFQIMISKLRDTLGLRFTPSF